MKTKSSAYWVFLTPALFAFIFVMVIPFVLGIVYSFTDWTSRPQPDGVSFVGLANYFEIFKDTSFLYSFILTLIFTILSVLVVNLVAFGLALLVTSKVRLKNTYKVSFFLPHLIGGLILGYVWQFIFNVLFPNLLGAEGGTVSSLMLANRDSAVVALIIALTWQYAGYIMMIYVAAILAIPEELFEASDMDGASGWRKIKNIVVPLSAQAFTVTSFLTMINSFKQFDVNVSLTGGGPSTQFLGELIKGTELLALNIYNTAFISNSLAESQAKSIIFFIVLTVFGVLQVRANKKREIEL